MGRLVKGEGKFFILGARMLGGGEVYGWEWKLWAD